MNRIDVTFSSSEENCAAWLYLPDSSRPHPCVILAHGFGGVRQARLDAYATRFMQAGLAALVFDYRHFGASEGEPRQLLDIKLQIADWSAALSYTRTLSCIDSNRIALWGASLSGGHVIEIASRDRNIAAVVAEVPFMDSFAVLRSKSWRNALQLTMAGFRDELQNFWNRSPYYIKIAGAPGTLAAMTSPDAVSGVRAMTPVEARQQDNVTARALLRIGFYRPIKHVQLVQCPLLICACDRDVVALPEPAIKAARIAPRGELRYYRGSHFDIFVGELFEQAVTDQSNFLTRYLLGNRD
jgi:uncharacterized protein